MRKINKIAILLLISSFALVGCDGLLNVDSDRQVLANQYGLTAANDSLNSMFGVFSQLEKLANSYVLLGELRGDLVDVTDKADVYLNQINDFNTSATNPYTSNIKDYYAVINNCNYIIYKVNQSIETGTPTVLTKELAACKAIRAWTYMQIALNYGSAIYYDKPILTVADAEAVQKLSSKSFDEIAPLLIADLEPYKKVDRPYFSIFKDNDRKYSFFPIHFLLGDLYLWTGQYENAANEYHDLMYENKYHVSNHIYTTLDVYNSSAFTKNYTYYFSTSEDESVTSITASNQYGTVCKLDSFIINRMIIPSDTAINNWTHQKYYYSATLDTLCDTRRFKSISRYTDSYDSRSSLFTQNYIFKYLDLNPISTDPNKPNLNKIVTPYRIPLLYLRYAEAVNRLGKPNMAFAVLKYGLNSSNIQRYVPASEKLSLPNYMNFPDAQFDYTTGGVRFTNIGVRMRGCGNVNQDTTYYRIPKAISKDDSITFVEDKIEQELRLETAFEGNRFQDLMRFAIRRNDNSYLAKKVAAKHKNNSGTIQSTLSLRENWYLKP